MVAVVCAGPEAIVGELVGVSVIAGANPVVV